MGFRPEPRGLHITFEGDLADMEMDARSVTVAEYLAMDSATEGELLEQFAAALVSWNLEDQASGEPVPPTLAGVQSQDLGLVARLISGWRRALVTVPPTSPPLSVNGSHPLEAS